MPDGIEGILGGLLKNPTVNQILVWQVMGQLFSPILQPAVAELQQLSFTAAPDLPLSPADAIDAEIKGHLDLQAAVDELKKNGLGSDKHDTLLASAGEPPGLQMLLELWRRAVIQEKGGGAEATSLEQGIRDSRLKNKWIEHLKQLRFQLPSVAEVMDAWLKGQIEEDEARRRYLQAGGLPDWFQTSYNAQGSAPSPLEAAEMARRGVIPWEGIGPTVTSYHQAFLEGPWRNKWTDPYRALAEYLPPPRTITAMLRAGSLTDEKAAELFRKQGLSAEMAAAYISDAHHQKTAADKQLAKADVLALYRDKIITREQAGQLLMVLDYSREEADWLMDIEDFRLQASLHQGAVNRIKTLFVARKLDRPAASRALDSLQASAAQRDQLIHLWEIERSNTVQRLTAAEWADALFYELVTEEEAIQGLIDLGWSPKDAWVRLAIRLHGKLKIPQPTATLPPP